ncbi:hypothetical protein MRB53_040250 [Persea americana]|nr:hypothetical protein MRB53_040250 [Persea americana]
MSQVVQERETEVPRIRKRTKTHPSWEHKKPTTARDVDGVRAPAERVRGRHHLLDPVARYVGRSAGDVVPRLIAYASV